MLCCVMLCYVADSLATEFCCVADTRSPPHRRTLSNAPTNQKSTPPIPTTMLPHMSRRVAGVVAPAVRQGLGCVRPALPSAAALLRPPCAPFAAAAAGSPAGGARRFRVLGVQQIAVGAAEKGPLTSLWVDLFGLTKAGEFQSEKENVDEDIISVGPGPYAVEIDLMAPLDPAKVCSVTVVVVVVVVGGVSVVVDDDVGVATCLCVCVCKGVPATLWLFVVVAVEGVPLLYLAPLTTPSTQKPRVDSPPLNHVGLWVDDIHAAVEDLAAAGVRFTPGGIRKGAAGHDVTFIHPKVRVSVILTFCHSACLSVCVCVCLSLSVSLCLSLCASVCVCTATRLRCGSLTRPSRRHRATTRPPSAAKAC